VTLAARALPCVVLSAAFAAPAPARAVAALVRAAAAWHGRLVRIALSLLLCSMLAPRAWDADTMLRAAQARGPQAVAGAQALQALLAGLAGQAEHAKLAAVNDFFNRRIAWAQDSEVWGLPDYWASPLEALAQGRGDCEDYVIAKYFSLLAADVPLARLRLVYVRAQVGETLLPHMVLAWYAAPGAEPLILDNLASEIRPASRRPDLVPVFSFNAQGLWTGVGAQSDGDPVARMSRWRDVLAKARAEGFQ
jgi:predicted transglutaminase-like cysteine proteinase